MNNVFVYCEVEGTRVLEVSQELLTKGRKLANQLGVQLHAVVAGTGIKNNVEELILILENIELQLKNKKYYILRSFFITKIWIWSWNWIKMCYTEFKEVDKLW